MDRDFSRYDIKPTGLNEISQGESIQREDKVARPRPLKSWIKRNKTTKQKRSWELE